MLRRKNLRPNNGGDNKKKRSRAGRVKYKITNHAEGTTKDYWLTPEQAQAFDMVNKQDSMLWDKYKDTAFKEQDIPEGFVAHKGGAKSGAGYIEGGRIAADASFGKPRAFSTDPNYKVEDNPYLHGAGWNDLKKQQFYLDSHKKWDDLVKDDPELKELMTSGDQRVGKRYLRTGSRYEDPAEETFETREKPTKKPYGAGFKSSHKYGGDRDVDTRQKVASNVNLIGVARDPDGYQYTGGRTTLSNRHMASDYKSGGVGGQGTTPGFQGAGVRQDEEEFQAGKASRKSGIGHGFATSENNSALSRVRKRQQKLAKKKRK